MKSKHVRLAAQIIFFALIALISVNHTLVEQGGGISFVPEVSLHAICPFGSIVTISTLATGQGLVRQLHPSVMVIGAVVLLLTIIFGPVFCSHICPLGSIQEWIGRLGKKVFKKKYNKFIPKKVHNVLKYMRYVVLILIVVQTYRLFALMFAKIDPYYALFHFWTGEATVISLVILGLTLIGSLFVERPWCKYACPYGAVLGLISKVSIFKIRRAKAACIDCGQCDNECPMLIDISQKSKVTDTLCNRCMKCTSYESGCPVNDTVYNGAVNAKEEI